MHAWMEGCYEPAVNVVEMITQGQAIAHQVRSPYIVHGLGCRTENERSADGSDICQEVKDSDNILRLTQRLIHF